jgi:excisionase family DNA binding protein
VQYRSVENTVLGGGLVLQAQSTQINPVVSPREAAEMLGIRMDTVYGLIWARRLQAEKRDGRWLVDRAAVVARTRDRATKHSPGGPRRGVGGSTS